jgi:hypothetical protein
LTGVGSADAKAGGFTNKLVKLHDASLLQKFGRHAVHDAVGGYEARLPA